MRLAGSASPLSPDRREAFSLCWTSDASQAPLIPTPFQPNSLGYGLNRNSQKVILKSKGIMLWAICVP